MCHNPFEVSIVIPVYNNARYLHRCLDSIINHTKVKYELIIVNDGSTDDSVKILEDYSTQYPDIFKIIHQDNLGQSAARNNGVDLATGRYLMFIDSDDWIEPNMIDILFAKIESTTSDIIICGFYSHFDDKSVEYTDIKLFYQNKYLPAFINVPWGKLYNLSYWRRNKFQFDESLVYEDLNLLPRVLFYTDYVMLIDQPLYNYERRNQLSTISTVKIEKYIFTIIDNLYDFYKANKYDHNFEIFLLKITLQTFYCYENTESRAKFKKILQDKRDLFKLENCFYGNQKMLVVLIKYKVPLSLIWKIYQIKQLLVKSLNWLKNIKR